MFDDISRLPPGKSLAEAHKERLAKQPDAWTYAWLKSQFEEILKAYRGLCHMLNLSVANMQDYSERVDRLEKRLEAVEAENQSLMARIGELQGENTLLQATVGKMRTWATGLKNGNKLEDVSA